MMLAMLVLVAVLQLLAESPLACKPVSGAEALMRPGAVILLGEIHGTRESPEAIGSLACLALQKGLPLTVALEIPRVEQPHIDAYLSGNESALFEGEFWTRAYQDGRSSRAMKALLSMLRSYQDAAPSLRVIAMDEPDSDDGRDAAMARRLNEIASQSSRSVVLALTGNIHNRLARGTRWDAEYQPMGYRLARLNPAREVVSLELTHDGGTAWICTGGKVEDCGVREIRGIEHLPPGIELYDASSDRPFSGRYHLGGVTASPPADEHAGRSQSPFREESG